MWNPASLAALITAIAGVIGAVTALIAAVRTNQKVNAQSPKTPVGGESLPLSPPTGPTSL